MSKETDIKEIENQLYHAILEDDLETVNKCLDSGSANVNFFSLGTKNPLNLAIESTPEIVRALLKHGANVNSEDVDGNTPLHNVTTAVNKGNIRMVTGIEIARILGEAGADGLHKNYEGKEPYKLLGHDRFLDMAEVLMYYALKSSEAARIASLEQYEAKQAQIQAKKVQAKAEKAQAKAEKAQAKAEKAASATPHSSLLKQAKKAIGNAARSILPSSSSSQGASSSNPKREQKGPSR